MFKADSAVADQCSANRLFWSVFAPDIANGAFAHLLKRRVRPRFCCGAENGAENAALTVVTGVSKGAWGIAPGCLPMNFCISGNLVEQVESFCDDKGGIDTPHQVMGRARGTSDHF